MSEKNKSFWFRKKGETKQAESRVDGSGYRDKDSVNTLLTKITASLDVFYWDKDSVNKRNYIFRNKKKALEYYDNELYDLAVECFRELAERGDSEAQCHLGECYYLGKGVNQDYYEAVKWFHKSVQLGNADAQCFLGICYYEGKGVRQSYVEAVEWFLKSAEQGNADAQYRLGICYYEGKAVCRNYSRAEEWILKSAEQGNADAQFWLGDQCK